jgi:hypothetical protein
MASRAFRFTLSARGLRGVGRAALVLALAAAGQPLAAQQQPSEDARLNDIARAAAQQFVAARAEEQTRPTVAPPPPGTQVNLTLQEATTRALERNLELAVERLNPQTFDLNIARIRAAYQPLATSSRTTRPTTTRASPSCCRGAGATSSSTSTTASRSRRTSSRTSTRRLRRTSTSPTRSRCCAGSSSTTTASSCA